MSEDLIRRQAAIEEVHHVVYEFFDFAEDDDESPMTYKDEMLLKLNKAITSRLKELPPAQPHWIPVTERLPKPNEREEDGVERYYLIQNEFKDMMVAAYRGNKSGDTWWEQMYAYKPVKDKVTAWMPLPTPWKGGVE